MTTKTFVIPGDLLGDALSHQSGLGTFEKNGNIYSSITGFTSIESNPENNKPTITVIYDGRSDSTSLVPKVGSVIIGKVTRISFNIVSVSILMFDGGIPLTSKGYSGQIRKENIVAKEIDTLKIEDCFKPGDIIKAEIVSLGDARNYVLSVLQPKYGVIQAKSTSSNSYLIQETLTTMKDPSTGEIVKRKVAMEE